MAVFYNKERAKYGNLTGQVIIWPVEYEGLPDGCLLYTSDAADDLPV